MNAWCASPSPCADIRSFTVPEEEERFLREARSAALLVHPNIVPVHEIAREGGMPYIVSDYIDGQTRCRRRLSAC